MASPQSRRDFNPHQDDDGIFDGMAPINDVGRKEYGKSPSKPARRRASKRSRKPSNANTEEMDKLKAQIAEMSTKFNECYEILQKTLKENAKLAEQLKKQRRGYQCKTCGKDTQKLVEGKTPGEIYCVSCFCQILSDTCLQVSTDEASQRCLVNFTPNDLYTQRLANPGHIMLYESKGEETCSVCEVFKSSAYEVTKHELKCTFTLMKCPHCEEKIGTAEDLQVHINEVCRSILCVPCGANMTWVEQQAHAKNHAALETVAIKTAVVAQLRQFIEGLESGTVPPATFTFLVKTGLIAEAQRNLN